MRLDAGQYAGSCDCGRTHTALTREIVLYRGATKEIAAVAAAAGLHKGGIIVCDENTRFCAEGLDAALGEQLHVKKFVCLPQENLHADEKAVALLEELLPTDAKWLIAAGAGTVHDVTRYVANSRAIHFISYPTAASVDGFVSSVCAMTWHGFKKTLPAAAPIAVVADTAVFAAAPYRLTASGIGDVLGKFTSLADWEIASLVTDEDYCARIAAMTREAADRVHLGLPQICAGAEAETEALMNALLLSGVAMQLWGNSRPASGAEHHLSHLWEMEVVNGKITALHGEKVGVAELIILSNYKKTVSALAAMDGNMLCPGNSRKLNSVRNYKKFGALSGDIEAENTPDPLESVSGSALCENLPQIVKIVNALPDHKLLAEKMATAGCRTTLKELGLSDDILKISLELSPYVRARLTLQRLSKLMENKRNHA